VRWLAHGQHYYLHRVFPLLGRFVGVIQWTNGQAIQNCFGYVW